MLSSRPRTGSFRMISSVCRDDVITYRRDESTSNARTYLSGNDVLDYIKDTLGFSYDEMEQRILLAQVHGRERDIHVQCHEPVNCEELLKRLPEIHPAGMKYVGAKATPDI